MIRLGRFSSPTGHHPGWKFQTNSRRFIRLPTRCSSPDHYKVLGLTPLASQAEVKRVYRRLALKFHPDVHKGQEKKFEEMKSAYEYLMQKFEEEEITETGGNEEWEEWMGFEGGIPSSVHTSF